MNSLKRILLLTVSALALLAMPSAGYAHSHKSHPANHRHHFLKRIRKHPSQHHHSSAAHTAIADGTVAEPSVSAVVAPASSVPQGHPTPLYRRISDRSHFYIAQNKSYNCGPDALAMAISDHVTGVVPTHKDVDKLTRETGTRKSDGMPDWWVVIPRVGAKHGLHTKVYIFAVGDRTAMDALDAELAQGHSAIVHVNNPRTRSGNGHFIYVAGRTINGGYVIGNPDSPANKLLGHDKEVSRQEIEDMMVMPPPSHPKTYKGTPGFVAVW